jgi:hypothetical protein
MLYVYTETQVCCCRYKNKPTLELNRHFKRNTKAEGNENRGESAHTGNTERYTWFQIYMYTIRALVQAAVKAYNTECCRWLFIGHPVQENGSSRQSGRIQEV